MGVLEVLSERETTIDIFSSMSVNRTGEIVREVLFEDACMQIGV